jgi:NAD(P)H dehydrogenase (quinone)
MILVTGAGGKTGKAIVRALAQRGAPVRALIRRSEQAPELKALGAREISVGNLDDAAALSRALGGIEAIYHICPNVNRDEVLFARAVVAAAQANRVARFVYHSVLHPQIEAMPHHWLKMRVEEFLLATGLDLTILQPTAYMQNIFGAWRGVVEDSVFRVPYPAETRLSLVDLDDVAEVAALVLTQDGHQSATYELVGTAPLSQHDVAGAIGTALKTGRIRIETEAVEAWEARVRAAGMRDYERRALTAMFSYYARHGLAGSPHMLRALLGRAPHDLAGFLDRAIAKHQSQSGKISPCLD